MRDFLESRAAALKKDGLDPCDLILYYVGHGLFSGTDQTYCFAIRATDARNEALTSIRASDLASILKNSARFWRKVLILDCCFSAAAYKEFQSGPLTAVRVKLSDELPKKGTTLLCSASAHDASLAPKGLPRTMFSDTLLRTLHQGHPSLGPKLSVSELGDLIRLNIKDLYPDDGVRPEVHSPDQRDGDISDLPLFPNPAHVARKTGQTSKQAEARTAQEEPRNEKKIRELIPNQVSEMRSRFLARVAGLPETPTGEGLKTNPSSTSQLAPPDARAEKRAALHRSWMSFFPIRYLAGRGEVQNEEAQALYEEAAVAGDATAMLILGILSEDVKKDYTKAREWYEKAATAGDARGMTNLGYLLESGLGGGIQWEEARRWYERAAAVGDKDAKRDLERMTPLGINSIKALSDE